MASFAQTYKRADGGPVDDEYLKALASFVYRNVSLVLTQVPEGMDLNKLFEVINNRGIQLQHHEILKARLLQDIPAESRFRFAALWNACADMSGFVERNLCLETQLEAHRLGISITRATAPCRRRTRVARSKDRLRANGWLRPSDLAGHR